MHDADLCPTPWCILDPRSHDFEGRVECRSILDDEEPDDLSVDDVDLDGCLTRAAYVFVLLAFAYLVVNLIAALR